MIYGKLHSQGGRLKEETSENLKSAIARVLKKAGAYKMRVAGANKGFKRALAGCHPHDLMTDCNSVIVFGVYVGTDYCRSIKIGAQTTEDHRIMHIFRDLLQYRVAEFLRERGYKAVVPRGFQSREAHTASLSYKLAAAEAGLGVYGKCGIIVTPEYGPRINFGVILTDAVIEPDRRLTEFDPCQNCRVCVDLCPPKAIKDGFHPPEGYNRQTCIGFVMRLRERLGDRNFLCGSCYDHCPIGKTARRGFVRSRYRTIEDLEPVERGSILSDVLSSVGL